MKIEDLSLENKVKTTVGYKKVIGVGKITMSGNRHNKTDKIYKLAKEKDDNLTKDLYITGGHSILVDELSEEQKKDIEAYWGTDYQKIDDKYLLLACVDKRFESIDSEEMFEIYHVCLENEDKNGHYAIWANGILSESISESCFDNCCLNKITN